MHRLTAGGTILEHELSDLRLLVERQAGILLDCPNSALAAHVAGYLESQELDSVAAVLERLRSTDQDSTCLPHFLDGVVNTDTGFFRHPGAMNALTRQVLPQLFARKSPDNPATLRMWSAGCSTGEEAYSIAMAACAALAGNIGNASGNSTTNAANSGNGNGGSNGSSGAKSAASRNGGIVDLPSSASGTIFSQPGTLQPGKEFSIHIVGSDLLASSIQIAQRGIFKNWTQRKCECFAEKFIQRAIERKVWRPVESVFAAAAERRCERREPADKAASAQPGDF